MMSASFTTYTFKPQLTYTWDAKYGKQLGGIKTASLHELDGHAAMA